MAIELDDSFVADAKRDLTRVAQDVVEVVRRLIPGTPPQGERDIVCFNHGGNPLVVWPPRSHDRYHIGVNLDPGRYYFRFAYQLSHELGHVMFDPSRSNGGLEILATAVSLQTLRDMEQLWTVRPPYPQFAGEAPKFAAYFDETEAALRQKFPHPVWTAVAANDWDSVAAEVRALRGTLRADPCHRPLNHLGARYLLARGVTWAETVGLAAKTIPAIGSAPTFHGNAAFIPTEIPDWLTPIWERV